MISKATAKKRFAGRNGIVFISSVPCSEASTKKLQQVFLEKKVIDKPFRHITRLDLGSETAYLFVCAKGERCDSASIWHLISVHPPFRMILGQIGSRIDALGAFLGQLEVDKEEKSE